MALNFKEEIIVIKGHNESNSLLLYIGKKIVEDVMDNTTINTLDLISKKVKYEILEEKLEPLTGKQLEIIKELILWITSKTVSNMLHLFEENEDIKLNIDCGDKEISIKEISNKLYEEFIGDDGWIEKFGKYLDISTEEGQKRYYSI